MDDHGKCKEFTLDWFMSDTYADGVIEKNRREFHEQWDEYLSELEDE
jgi:hypothetical protein